MPGQPSPTSEVPVAVDTAIGEYFHEEYDDPDESLVVPMTPVSPGAPSDPGADQTDSAGDTETVTAGNCAEEGEIFEENGRASPVGEDELTENWDPSLYTLQSRTPKPKCVICKEELQQKPAYYGEEFHGVLTREDAALLLGNECGRYLVRESPKGDFVLSFMLDGRMWNYKLFYEDDMHYVGDKRFDNVEEMVADGLITLYMQKHNVCQAMEKGRAITRKKTLKLRRQHARRVRGPSPRSSYLRLGSQNSTSSLETQTATMDFRKSLSSEPPSPPSSGSSESLGSLEASKSDVYLESPNVYIGSPNVFVVRSAPQTPVLTPNSSAFQSDLDFTPPVERKSASSLQHSHRNRALCIDTKSLSQRRARSTECLQKERGKYSAVFALRDVVRAEQAEIRRSMDFSTLTPFGEGGLKKTSSAETPLFQLALDVKPQTKPRSHTYHSSSKETKDKIVGKPPNGIWTFPRSNKPVVKKTTKTGFYYKAHKFKAHTYISPTWCEICHHFLWGIKHQGLRCQDCGMDIHKQCVNSAMGHECNPTPEMVKRVFGVDLTTMVKLEKTVVPSVLKDCINEIESRDLSSEGMYRVSGHATEILDLKEKYDSSEPVDFSQYLDINIITGAVKLYFRDLPIPLVTFDVYSEVMKATATVSDVEDPNVDWKPLANALKLLPKAHYNTLKYLAEHLHRVEQYSGENKMTASNLAVIFAPTLMKSPNEELSIVRNFPIQRHFVEYIILKHELLFD